MNAVGLCLSVCHVDLFSATLVYSVTMSAVATAAFLRHATTVTRAADDVCHAVGGGVVYRTPYAAIRPANTRQLLECLRWSKSVFVCVIRWLRLRQHAEND